MDGIVPLRYDTARDGQHHKNIQNDLGDRRTDTNLAYEGRTQGPEDPEIGKLNVSSDRIGNQIDVMAEFTEGLDAVLLAEGGAARLEKRLGREHQDAHGSLYLTEPMVVRLQ